jgi:hypothetical protein
MEPAHLVRGASDWTLKQVADPVLQNPVSRQADRIFDPLGFEELVDIGIGEARVGAERRPNTDCRNNPANACRPFLPVRASARTSLAIVVSPRTSSSSR